MGVVEFDREIRNQRDEVVQSAKATNMYLRRPST
jgi:acyl dehydratase